MTAVLRADALRLPLRDESVDLIVTSPPYFALRSYQDDGEHYEGQIGSEATPQAFLEALWAVTAECCRVLKPSGSMFVNLGDKYAGSGGHNNSAISGKSTLTGGKRKLLDDSARHQPLASRRSAPDAYNKATIGGARPKSLMLLPERYRIGCVDQLDLIARAVIVWSKPNGLPESVTDRVRRSHEDWVHITREPHYYADVDPIREPHKGDGLGPSWEERKAAGEPMRHGLNGAAASGCTRMASDPNGKLPGSVWSVDYDLWEELRSGPFAFCPRCGRGLGAGSGRASSRERVTVGSRSPAEVSSTPTGSATNSTSDPSPTDSPSTTSAGTGGAFDPTTCKPSVGERTSSEAESPSKPTASTDTPSPTRTSTVDPTATVASAARVTRSECVCEALGREPVGAPSVWKVATEPLVVPEYLGLDHFAAFPQELPRRFILGWCPPAGVVLDPFGGTGTTAMVARALGRTGVSVDLSADYCRLARWRIFDSGHASKTRERTNREAQQSIFGGAA